MDQEARQCSDLSEVASLGRRQTPIVVATVKELDRCVGKFVDLNVIKAGKIDGEILAAENVEMSTTECMNTTCLAEKVVHAVTAKLIIRQGVLARNHPKRARFDDRAPISLVGANRAIAFARIDPQVDFGLMLDLAAMAAPFG